MKISSCADQRTWELLVEHGESLIKTRFGRADGASPELKAVADEICWRGIKVMLDVCVVSPVVIYSHRSLVPQLESPNLHEIGLDRVIAFGHSLSPTLELTPIVPLRHGHAVSLSTLPCHSASHPYSRSTLTCPSSSPLLATAACFLKLRGTSTTLCPTESGFQWIMSYSPMI